MAIHFGVTLPQIKRTWDETRAAAQEFESLGYDSVWLNDHLYGIPGPQIPIFEAWTTLSAVGAVTSRVQLGTLVSPVTFRHPSVLARMAVTVDHISGGRVEVGMGSGWYEREHLAQGFPFPAGRQRFALLAEQVEVVVRSWTGERFEHDGPAYRLRGQLALPRPVQQPHPPLILGGAVKPRFAELAARYATEVNTLGAPDAELRERKLTLDRACEAIGRDPRTLGFSVMTACFAGAERAEAVGRIGRFLSLGGDRSDPSALLAERRDVWLAGSVEEVAERIAALAELGVTRVFLQHLNADDDAMVALLAERLLPALR